MGDFDPYTQNVTFLASDGKTPLSVPLPMVDAFHTESVSICLNYGSQLGACVIMLAVVFVMTPSPKLRRPSSLLHITGLVLCIIRMALLSAYFPSPFNDFYAYWAYDYSHVPIRDFVISIVANTFSLLLVIAIEAALMHQAWTMVKLWPNFWKYTLSALSAFITLFTIGWRVAFTVIQNKAVLSLIPPENMRWLIHLMVITNAVSICWFCAIFNIKLVIHLISNRGVLPSYKTMTPMEVLIATNGVLMIVPVIFAGLEWGHFTNFESASLTLTSVAIILPLGTLSAQRMASKTTSAYASADSSGRYPPTTGTGSSAHPIKRASFSTNHTGTAAQVSILSRCEAAMMPHARPGSSGVELANLTEEAEADGHHVRVDRNLVQREERI
ncbi:fungal pheromone mating factor STE2 GPCR-domain-containing protein [Dactylonectria macrodidyma]|uniref:Fungal pheromone mating factor STE2 GPCR-domain-containing protein n=1 Tax=Dactylonectria macrodidyma TaxID=307937 RepID=A0A9P9DIL5_9HYPO|nr:fungal pheromone mating factor STE2 GPCR-domain-containing protein [Dactylonectria macrodidyma]